MAFVKRCRGDVPRFVGLTPPLPMANAAAAVPQPPMAVADAGHGVGGGMWNVAMPRTIQQEASGDLIAGMDVFMKRYPIDERARDYFSCCSAEVQDRILREFRPPREGEADYSSLFMAFVKRCRQQQGGHRPEPVPLHSQGLEQQQQQQQQQQQMQQQMQIAAT